MTNLTRSNFQAHPFHLVSPSPWPLFTCIALFTLTTAGVLTMHGFSNAGYFLTLGFLSLIGSMAFWFRDVISEGIVFCFTLVVMTVACLFTNQFENIGDNIYLLIPAVTYKNADVQKAQILLENKNKSGVYIWVNLINGKKYVGSSKDIRARLYQYYNVNYLVNYNMYIYKALLKYGYSNFSLDIVMSLY